MSDRDDGGVDVPEQLTLRVGQSASVRLPGLGTAGYRWTDHRDSDAVDATWQRGFDGADTRRAVGMSAPETVTLTGRRPGTATVDLVQARPWESPDAALHRQRITVTVVE
ncbi:protease inhibitor I42 family protein [Flexivirga oryzae]|uniref:Putative secreted protein n=1 Tax=Flexivirga oryzae TaxID=1794944 RepID=A0A839N8D5_9MICO|nr:protease inhibitor I42 family protein [Flexivirga oryzae]MBB2891886.1 putative secreted protein [Flexivirga oryzae]